MTAVKHLICVWHRRGLHLHAKGKPQAANVDAALLISDSSSVEAGTDEDPEAEAPPLQAEEQQLISLIYLRFRASLPKEWSGEGGTVSQIVRTLGCTVNWCRRGKEVIANYHHSILMAWTWSRSITIEIESISNHNTAIAKGSQVH